MELFLRNSFYCVFSSPFYNILATFDRKTSMAVGTFSFSDENWCPGGVREFERRIILMTRKATGNFNSQ
jgi:hypothetical protein